MMEFPEPVEDGQVFRSNGHESDLHAPHGTASKADPSEEMQSTVAEEERAPQRHEPSDDEEEADIIREIVEELSGAQRASRQLHRLAEQAACVVERYARQAPNDSAFKEYASRPAKSPDQISPRGDMSDDSALIEAMYKAASRATNERECGLQAALAVPLMIRQYPQAQRELWMALPGLTIGMNMLARFLHRAGVNRSLIMELPDVLRATLDRLAWYVSHRRTMTSALAGTVLAEQTGMWLVSRPRQSSYGGNGGLYRTGTDELESPEE